MKKINVKYLLLFVAILSIMTIVSGCDNFASPSVSATELCINEVVTSNSRSLIDEKLGSPDWIELYNPTSEDINLGGFYLTDNIKDPHKWTFPSVTIKAGETLIVYAMKTTDAPAGTLCTGFGLSKSGELVYLISNYNEIISQVTVPALMRDVSYARMSDGKYGYCGSPTPNELNDDSTIVTDLKDLVYEAIEGALVISEVVPHNSSTLKAADGHYYPWLELHNTASEPIMLDNYWISDDEFNLNKYQLPNVILQPDAYFIVFLSGNNSDNDDETHASFRLGSMDTGIYLCDRQGALASYITWAEDLPDNISVVGNEGEKYTGFPTPFAKNSDSLFSDIAQKPMDANSPIRLSEVLPKNKYSIMDADGDRPEWVELVNVSGTPQSLDSVYISDDSENPTKWGCKGIVLQPNEHIVIFLSGKDRQEGELHASFGLSSSDSHFLVTNADGMFVDKVPIDPTIGDDVSIGIGSDNNPIYYSHPTPGMKNDSSYSFGSLAELKPVNTNSVYISEVSAVSVIKTTTPNWIEVYNGTSSSVNLKGWYLSDDKNDLKKWQVPSNLSLGSKDYGLIYCTTSEVKAKGVTAPFGLSSAGETLFLSDPDGFLADAFETGAQNPGISSGRKHSDGSGTRYFFTSSTPGAQNTSSAYPAYAKAPVYSDVDLYHSSSFKLEITCPTPGAKIYYTTDGSKPTSSSALYSGPVTISSSKPIRSIAVADGMLNSDVSTVNFIFEKQHTVPVVCISGNPETIQSVYRITDRWQIIEREAYASYYEKDGRMGVQFPMGLKVKGAGTLVAAQKGLTMCLRGGYGQKSVTYPFFKGHNITTYRALSLRAMGQDQRFAYIRDAYANRVVNGMRVDNAQNHSVALYINGKYWGLYSFIEEQNSNYLESKYGVDADNCDVVRRNTTALKGTNEDFKRVRAFAVSNNLADDAKYEQFMQWVDEDYFIDYIAAQSFFGNGDFFNQKYWRSNDYTIKWRPVFFDLDFAFPSGGSMNRNLLGSYFNPNGIPSQDLSLTNTDIFCGLRENKKWQDKFAARYIYLIYNFFNEQRLTQIFDELVDEMRPEMQRQISRWGHPSSMSKWDSELKGLRNYFAKRQQPCIKQIQNEFGYSDAEMQAMIDKAKAGITE